jgi:transposase
MDQETKQRKKRKKYATEIKAGAVRLVLEEGKKIPEVARDLDLQQASLRRWVEQAKADRGIGKPGALTSVEREELTRLRKENRILQMEREILKNDLARRASCWTRNSSIIGGLKRNGRPLIGAIEPVKKHGLGVAANLIVVTPLAIPFRKVIDLATPPPEHPTFGRSYACQETKKAIQTLTKDRSPVRGGIGYRLNISCCSSPSRLR